MDTATHVPSALMKQRKLDQEDAAAIALYTFDFGPGACSQNPYRIINSSLVGRGIMPLRKNRGVIFHILKALRKLPKVQSTGLVLYRGITRNVCLDQKHYYRGNKITWHTFSSTTTDLEVTKYFLTDQSSNSEGTIFIIRGRCWGYDIQQFSCLPGERGINWIFFHSKYCRNSH